MSENKTQKNEANVDAFLNSVENETRRRDGFTLSRLMQEITGEEPAMWGGNIIGFGSYHYKYASGREGDFLLTGFSPRKQSLSLYIMSGFGRYEQLLEKLGKYKTGKACLYVNKLADIDLEVLKELIAESVDHMKKTH